VFDAGQADTEYAMSMGPAAPGSVRLVVPVSNIGILGYIAGSDVHVVDRMGLADPIAARLVLAARDRPGHEKLLPWEWVVARFADPDEGRGRFPGTPAALRALQCGELASLVRAVYGPLTPSRFAANIRDAWALSRLRIPADPVEAGKRFCSSQAAQ
jgi:arabinofuranosyltransferase